MKYLYCPVCMLVSILFVTIAYSEDKVFTDNDVRWKGAILYDLKTNTPINGLVTRIYSKTDKLKSEITYRDGKPVGLGKGYYESGKLKSEFPYKNGKKEGLGKKYYESGKLKNEVPYENDVEEGIEKEYYESGKLKGEYIYSSGFMLTGFIYDENGIKTELKDKVFTGEDVKDKSSIRYDIKTNTPINGLVRSYYNNKLKYEITFRDGEPVGLGKEYYESGKLKREFPYKKGLKNGIEKEYYESGKLKGEYTYLDGLTFTGFDYDENGKKTEHNKPGGVSMGI